MAENLGEARLRLTADSKNLDKTLKRVGQQTRKIGIAMTGVGVAIAAPLAAAVKVFAEYEQSMAQVQAVSGATTSTSSEPWTRSRGRWADDRLYRQGIGSGPRLHEPWPAWRRRSPSRPSPMS